jgi:hypothetical protein
VDTVLVDKTTPYGMNLLAVWQKREVAFDESDFLLRFADSQAESVPIHGPCQNVPEFDDILRAIVQAGVLLKELADRILNKCVRGIATPGQAQQDMVSNRYPAPTLIVVLVNHLAREGLSRQGRNFVGELGEGFEPIIEFFGRKLLRLDQPG